MVKIIPLAFRKDLNVYLATSKAILNLNVLKRSVLVVAGSTQVGGVSL